MIDENITHIDDRTHAARTFIKELEKVQDLYYNKIFKELMVSDQYSEKALAKRGLLFEDYEEDIGDYFFDYMYNDFTLFDEEPDDFIHFLMLMTIVVGITNSIPTIKICINK